MFSNDQPSILTVCVPGIVLESTNAGIEQILAARLRDLDSSGNNDPIGPCDPPRGAATGVGCQQSFFHAESGTKALELLRILRFDLLVTGDSLPDMAMSQLIRRVRVAWPWQKWAMVGSMLTSQDEIVARSLGAMAVFDAPADWDALASLAVTAAARPASIRRMASVQLQHGGALQLTSLSGEQPASRPMRPVTIGFSASVAEAG
jgi:CheY-like chemotaxis protein